MEIKIQIVASIGVPYYCLAQGLRKQVHRPSEVFAHFVYRCHFLKAGFPFSGRGLLKTRRAVFQHDAGIESGVSLYYSFERSCKFLCINAGRQFVEGR